MLEGSSKTDADGAVRPLVSLIIPAYDEADSAKEIVGFYHEVIAAHPAYRFELIVVDDGSTDGTAEAIGAHLEGGDELAKIVRLSRNFGSHAGITAGLAQATGDAALTLSADRQEPLTAIGQFLSSWADGADLVWGLRSVRATNKGASETFATTFSKIYNQASDVPTYPQEGPSQILVSRPVIDVLLAMPERNRNVLAMAAWTGFDQRKIFFEQLPRPYGVSKWTSSKKIKLVIDSFVEFSAAPIRWLTVFGMFLGVFGGLSLLVALVLLLVPAWSAPVALTLSGVVFFVGGINLFGLGVVGEYVWRGGDDARRRPVYIIRSVHQYGVAQAR